MAEPERHLDIAGIALWALLVLAGAAGLLVALTVPYHHTDGLLFGEWSRLIAGGGGLHIDSVGVAFLQRPLFYVGQGLTWEAFGFSEWSGRLLSLGFGVLLAWSLIELGRLAGGVARAGAVAGCLLIACPDFARDALAGQTDVPVAALVGACAVILWRRDRGAMRTVLLVVLTSSAMLAKPSAILTLVGLMAAALIGSRDDALGRARRSVLPIAVGFLGGLLYEALMARHVGVPLSSFLGGLGKGLNPADLSAGTDYFAALNHQIRVTVVLGMEWMGPYLVVPLLFALAYGPLRAAGVRHGVAARVAAPLCATASVLLPLIGTAAGSTEVGPWHANRPAAALASLAFLVMVFCASRLPDADAPSRLWMARLVVWTTPPLLVWIVLAPSNTRYLAPAWPPLLALMGVSLWNASRGAALVRPLLGPATLGLVVLIGVADMRNFDALGTRPDGSINSLRAVRALGLGGWLHPERARRAADPALGGELADARRALRPGGTLLTSDGRMGFFFPGHVAHRKALRCQDAHGADAFILITSTLSALDPARLARLAPATRAQLARTAAGDPAFWAACASPRLTLAGSQPGAYAVFRIERGS